MKHKASVCNVKHTSMLQAEEYRHWTASQIKEILVVDDAAQRIVFALPWSVGTCFTFITLASAVREGSTVKSGPSTLFCGGSRSLTSCTPKQSRIAQSLPSGCPSDIWETLASIQATSDIVSGNVADIKVFVNLRSDVQPSLQTSRARGLRCCSTF